MAPRPRVVPRRRLRVFTRLALLRARHRQVLRTFREWRRRPRAAEPPTLPASSSAAASPGYGPMPPTPHSPWALEAAQGFATPDAVTSPAEEEEGSESPEPVPRHTRDEEVGSASPAPQPRQTRDP